MRSNKYFQIICFLFICHIFLTPLAAQEKNQTVRLGFNFGIGSQAKFPFNNTNYLYRNEFYKVQVNYLVPEREPFRVFYSVDTQLVAS